VKLVFSFGSGSDGSLSEILAETEIVLVEGIFGFARRAACLVHRGDLG